MKLPKYDAILGKSWLDRWNPDIDWRESIIIIQVGKKESRFGKATTLQLMEKDSRVSLEGG